MNRPEMHTVESGQLSYVVTDEVHVWSQAQADEFVATVDCIDCGGTGELEPDQA